MNANSGGGATKDVITKLDRVSPEKMEPILDALNLMDQLMIRIGEALCRRRQFRRGNSCALPRLNLTTGEASPFGDTNCQE